jgi:hypothetical protein
MIFRINPPPQKWGNTGDFEMNIELAEKVNFWLNIAYAIVIPLAIIYFVYFQSKKK